MRESLPIFFYSAFQLNLTYQYTIKANFTNTLMIISEGNEILIFGYCNKISAFIVHISSNMFLLKYRLSAIIWCFWWDIHTVLFTCFWIFISTLSKLNMKWMVLTNNCKKMTPNNESYWINVNIFIFILYHNSIISLHIVHLWRRFLCFNM